MESESSSNCSSCEEAEELSSTHYVSHRLRSSPSAPEGKSSCSVIVTPPSSSSTTSESLSNTVDKLDELSSFVTTEKDVDGIDLGNDPFADKEDFEVTDSCGATGTDRVDPFPTGLNRMSGERSEISTEINLNDHRGDKYAGPPPQLREATSTERSLLGSLARLVIRSIEFQVSLMLSFIKFPPSLIHSCLSFVLDPYRTMRRGRRYVLSRVVELCDLGLKDDKLVLEVVRRLAWGLFWAVYVGIVLFALLVSAFMISGFVMANLAHGPLVIKERLNFDYTKNNPETFVPITSCDSSCKESMEETGKIRGLKVNLQNHRTEISVSMTLPESEYNRNLGMFQVRVDFLTETGQILATSRRMCMLRFRSEPIRLIQTLLKIAPLVTGYVSESQTLNLKLKGFAEKDIIHTACLKVMIEKRAEFRPGAGIPEIYDASLLLQSELPFFKRIIWNWRRTLFVWISMSLFITELLFALVFFRSLIIPRTGQRTQQRDGTPSNNTSNLDGQAGSR